MDLNYDFDLDVEQGFDDMVNDIVVTEQYKQILDQIALVSKTDASGNILYANDKFCSVSGYSREELVGQPHSKVRHSEIRPGFFEELWSHIQQKHVWHGVVKNRHKTGSTYWVKTNIFPILNAKGEIVEFVSVRFLISKLERKNLLSELEITLQAHKRALNELLGEVAQLGHVTDARLNALLQLKSWLEGNKFFVGYAQEWVDAFEAAAEKEAVLRQMDIDSTTAPEQRIERVTEVSHLLYSNLENLVALLQQEIVQFQEQELIMSRMPISVVQ